MYLRSGLLVVGSALVLGTIMAHLFTDMPGPTRLFVGSIGFAFLLWHNAVVVLQRAMQRK